MSITTKKIETLLLEYDIKIFENSEIEEAVTAIK